MNEQLKNIFWVAKHSLQKDEIKQEVKLVCDVLYSAKSAQQFHWVNEVADLNNYKIIRKPHLVQQIIADKLNKPFVFIINKN